MAKNAVFGVKSIKFAEPVAGGFPTDWTEFDMRAIVKDSVTYNDSAPGENNIEVEDMDEYYAILNSDKGQRGFTIKGYDLSEEAYKFFFGYTDGTDDNAGFVVETPGTETTLNKSVQIITKPLGNEFSAKQFEWANMRITAVMEGNIGKSGFPNVSLTCVKQANIDADGNEVAGARWKTLSSEEYAALDTATT